MSFWDFTLDMVENLLKEEKGGETKEEKREAKGGGEKRERERREVGYIES